MSKLAIAYAIKRKKKMAEGGFVDKEKASGYRPMPEDHEKPNHMAMEEDDRILNQHGEDEIGPYGAYAKGGFIGSHQGPEHELDMIERILMRRHKGKEYSEGGKVANDDHPFEFDFDTPNEFDDLVLRDNLESSYTGKNSGDELGNEQEDEDRSDTVSKIMASRRKKDRNPRPA